MDLQKLTTEGRNPDSTNIDEMDTLSMVELMNRENEKVVKAVEAVSQPIADAIDAIAPRFLEGGRLIYMGAGTSGRLGALDAIELEPTYNVNPDRAFGILAGGKEAMYSAIEGAEDSAELAIADLKENQLTDKDVVISIAASGRTPYAIAALEYAKEIGALAVSVTCNDRSKMAEIADISIAPIVGPEVITGSTRMKAGSAQKMVLNTISTGVMVRCGKVYQNLMVNVRPTNEKLIHRAISIIMDATGCSHEVAEKALDDNNKDVAVAIVMVETNTSSEEASSLLKEANGMVRQAIAIGK